MSMSDDAPEPRWRRQAEIRPDAILDAAQDQFLKKGFAGARVEDIAHGAGLSKGAVYRYFDSKEAMFKALVRRAVSPIARAAAERMDAGGDPEATLREAAAIFGAAMSDHSRFAVPRLILAEAGAFPEHTRFYREEVVDVGLGALTRLIRHGIDRGVFRNADPDVAARSLMGALMLHMIWLTTFASEDEAAALPIQDLAARHVDLLLKGLKA